MTTQQKLILASLLILVGVLGRTLPHWWNVAPIAAIGLVATCYLGWRYGMVVPIIALALGDIFFLGTYEYGVMASVYGSFALIALFGLMLRGKLSILTLIGVPIAASVTFFVISNFAVWLTTPWYSKTLEGLIDCYTFALPFFRNTLLGDLTYTVGLVALFRTVESILPALKTAPRNVYPRYDRV